MRLQKTVVLVLVGLLRLTIVWAATDTIVVTKGAVTALTFPSKVVTVQLGNTQEQECQYTLAGHLVLLKAQRPFPSVTNMVVITQRQVYYLLVVYREPVDMALLNVDFSKGKSKAVALTNEQEILRKQLSTCNEAVDTMVILNTIDTVIAARIAADYRLQHKKGSIGRMHKAAITFKLEDVMKLNKLLYLRWYWSNRAGLPVEIVRMSVCMKSAATTALMPLRTCLKLPPQTLPAKSGLRQVLVISAPIIDKADELFAVVQLRNIPDPLVLRIKAGALPKYILEPG
ncbi:MAG: DUF4138 domain-containing protein [Chitinophaga sp.]|uniref:hypothetical protein n=1 Tax=Chitinophaga sp. TaxID=1869181 RepID=UPI0025BF0B82|nr:hypothetical protein [Chitinophaga sp.]MBV8253232.1 DUF4138 domain-containing protein [Chitinophaga sp.]